MQKKIIVLAIAAMVSAPAFADNANITFYGVADVSNDFVTTGDGTAAANTGTVVSGRTKRVISSNTSKFGFKGAEDLGDGLSAIWQIEQQVDIDASAKNTFASRNTFAGLKHNDYGTVLMGRHDTPYKLATRALDVFGDHIADNRALMGRSGTSGDGFELRPTDVVAYISPAFSGVTVAVATANMSETKTKASDALDGALSAAVMYSAEPFFASVAYESHRLPSLGSATILAPEENATRVGFGFKANGMELNAMYEKTADTLGALNANKYGHNAYYIGAKYSVGAGAFKLAYVSAGAYDGTVATANTGATQVSVGYDHALSKRSTVYAMYSRIANDKGATYVFSQNTAGSTGTNGYGGTPTALSLGLKHTF